jgi:hypothetical protein
LPSFAASVALSFTSAALSFTSFALSVIEVDSESCAGIACVGSKVAWPGDDGG